jgi:membrane protein YfhO
MTFVVYGIPIVLGSSWLPAPDFPHRVDQSRQPAFRVGYDNFSFAHFDLPYREIARHSAAEGEIPLWNANSWLGVPIAAQYQDQVFSPLEWIDWLGGNRWWNVTLLLRIALAGLGTFLLVRRLTSDETVASVAATLYVLSSYFSGFQSIAAFVNAAALLPWLFLAVDHAFRDRGLTRSMAFVGAVFGLAAVTGQPQIALLNVTAAVTFALFVCAGAPDWIHRRRGVLAVVGGSLIALAVASPQLAAFAEGLRNGYTIHEQGAYAEGTTLLNLFVPVMPMLLGPMMSPWLGSIYPAHLNHEAFPMLLGAAWTFALSLGVLSVFLPADGRSRRERMCLSGLLVILSVTLGLLFAGAVHWGHLWSFPIANRINLPRYSPPLLSLSAAILAAVGLGAAARLSRRWLVLALMTSCAAIALLHYGAWPVLTAPLAETNAPLRTQSLVFAELSGWVSLAGAAIILSRSPAARNGSAGTAVSILIAAELWLCTRYGFDLRTEWLRLIPWFALIVAGFAWAWQRRLASWIALGTAIATFTVLSIIAPNFLERSRDPVIERDPRVDFLRASLGPGSSQGRVLPTACVMTPNMLAAMGIAQINGLNPLQPRLATEWFRSALAERGLNYTLPVSWYGMLMGRSALPVVGPLGRCPVRSDDWPQWTDYAGSRLLYNFIGIRYLVESSHREVSTLSLPDVRLVLDTPDYRILEDTRAWPRAFLARGGLVAAPQAEGQKQALAARAERQFATLDVDGPPERIATLNAGSDQLQIDSIGRLEIRNRVVRVAATSAAPALLVLNDVAYPGWRAWVDGAEQPIWTVQGVTRGVPFPAGSHTVEFRYIPSWLYPTVTAAATGWLFVALVGLGRFRSSVTRSDRPSQKSVSAFQCLEPVPVPGRDQAIRHLPSS